MSSDIQHPGVFLLERYLQPLEITPSELANALDIEERRVCEPVEGRGPITADTAARLALFFDVPPRWWLELQARYDAVHVAQPEALRGVVAPYARLSDILVTPHGVTRLAPTEALQKEASKATFSEDFLHRLREQAKWVDDGPRTVSETTLDDGTVALLGE